MSKLKKRIAKLLANPRDCTLREIWPILEYYDYGLARIKGSHHVFRTIAGKSIIIPVHNGKIKKKYLKDLKILVNLTQNYEI